MVEFSRREYIAAAVGAIQPLTACVIGDSRRNPEEGNRTETNETGSESEDPPTNREIEGIQWVDAFDWSDEKLIPGWDATEDGDAGAVQVFASPRDVEQYDAESMPPDYREDFEALLSTVEFEDEILILVETVSHRSCYEGEHDITGLGDGTVTGEYEATTIEQEETSCDGIVYPSVFYNLTFAPDKQATAAEFLISNTRGDSELVRGESVEH